ncbi:unnamed protein product, partial [Oikopleura dioica]
KDVILNVSSSFLLSSTMIPSLPTNLQNCHSSALKSFPNSCLSTEAINLHFSVLVDSLSSFGKNNFTHSSISFLKTALSSSFSVNAAKKQNSVNISKMKMRSRILNEFSI